MRITVCPLLHENLKEIYGSSTSRSLGGAGCPVRALDLQESIRETGRDDRRRTRGGQFLHTPRSLT